MNAPTTALRAALPDLQFTPPPLPTLENRAQHSRTTDSRQQNVSNPVTGSVATMVLMGVSLQADEPSLPSRPMDFSPAKVKQRFFAEVADIFLRLVTQQVNEAKRSWRDFFETQLNDLIVKVADYVQVSIQSRLQLFLASELFRQVSHSSQQKGHASVPKWFHDPRQRWPCKTRCSATLRSEPCVEKPGRCLSEV